MTLDTVGASRSGLHTNINAQNSTDCKYNLDISAQSDIYGDMKITLILDLEPRALTKLLKAGVITANDDVDGFVVEGDPGQLELAHKMIKGMGYIYKDLRCDVCKGKGAVTCGTVCIRCDGVGMDPDQIPF